MIDNVFFQMEGSASEIIYQMLLQWLRKLVGRLSHYRDNFILRCYSILINSFADGLYHNFAIVLTIYVSYFDCSDWHLIHFVIQCFGCISLLQIKFDLNKEDILGFNLCSPLCFIVSMLPPFVLINKSFFLHIQCLCLRTLPSVNWMLFTYSTLLVLESSGNQFLRWLIILFLIDRYKYDTLSFLFNFRDWRSMSWQNYLRVHLHHFQKM